MTPIMLACLLGFVGTLFFIFGVFVAAMCRAASDTDDYMDRRMSQ